MKIGLFGGTFDPIHWAHLRSAEEVREGFSLDRVLFIPASIPPFERKSPSAPAKDRVAMVRLAISGSPAFGLSDIEVSRPGKSYTVDTLRALKLQRKGKYSPYFILGLDAFREIGKWKNFEELFSLCHMIVTSRPSVERPMSLRGMPVAVRKLFCYDSRKKGYRHKSGHYLFFFKITDLAISASKIRRYRKKGKSIRYLVPREVERYVKRKGLYR